MLGRFGLFFSYPLSSGIAPCVGTVGTVHMTPSLDAALLYLYERAALQLTHPYNTHLWVGGYCRELLYYK